MKTLVKFRYLDSQGFKLYSTPQDFDMAMYKFLNHTRGIIPEQEVEELKEKAKHLNVYSDHYRDEMWRQFLLDNGYRDIEIGIMKDGPITFLNGYWCADFRTFNSFFEVYTIGIEIASAIEILFGDEYGIFPL